VNTRWLSAALNSDAFKRQVQAITAGVTRPKVTLSDFRKLRIVRPNIGEQTRIASRLEGLADLLTVEDEKLAKIRQQKHGLMHDLLSGKKRVSTN
jgi:type I restriction enzyme S subunit